MRLSQDIRALLAQDAALPNQALTVGDLLDRVGDKGFGLLLVILSLPSALPVPAPGYSIPFGILLFVIGLQMAIGRHHPTLPRRLCNIRLQATVAKAMLSGAEAFFRRLELFVRPRLRWINSRGGRAFVSGLVLLMAFLMVIPIPWTNTLPALIIFLIGVGLTEEDGAFAILAAIGGCLTVALYAGALYFLIAFFQEYGWHAFAHFFDLVKETIRRLLSSS